MEITNMSNFLLISLLKQYGIKRLVLSSGARNIPFVTAVETDDYFECFSVIDERNAAFFGLGMCQQLQEPIAIACTSGTAASNYLTGVTEAYYSHAPLVIITCDRSPYTLNQLETQKIDQPAIFTSVVKKSVSLPVIKDADDIWYCQRLLNEAFISLKQHQPGPVHINIPLVGDTNALWNESLKKLKNAQVRKIDYVAIDDTEIWQQMVKTLSNRKRVIVVMGQDCSDDENLHQALRQYCSYTQVPILLDNLSNFRCSQMVWAEPIIKALNAESIEGLLPEVVITLGNNFQERIKDLLKAHQGKFEHWSIDQEGVIRDVFKSQTALFECKPAYFFSYFTKNVIPTDGTYCHRWQELAEAIKLPEMPFTNFYVIKEFTRVIPKDSILHLSILNATRLTQFFDIDPSIKVYSNVNSFGIDGCLPTFIGQSVATDTMSFLVIGDLSFFYGMNALAIKHKKSNIRILLINNGGGAEFHIVPSSNAIPTIDKHIGAAHNHKAQGWAESMEYKYVKADDKESFSVALNEFIRTDHDSPVLLEVFTNMKTDGEFCLSVYREAEKCINPLL